MRLSDRDFQIVLSALLHCSSHRAPCATPLAFGSTWGWGPKILPASSRMKNRRTSHKVLCKLFRKNFSVFVRFKRGFNAVQSQRWRPVHLFYAVHREGLCGSVRFCSLGGTYGNADVR